MHPKSIWTALITLYFTTIAWSFLHIDAHPLMQRYVNILQFWQHPWSKQEIPTLYLNWYWSRAKGHEGTGDSEGVGKEAQRPVNFCFYQ